MRKKTASRRRRPKAPYMIIATATKAVLLDDTIRLHSRDRVMSLHPPDIDHIKQYMADYPTRRTVFYAQEDIVDVPANKRRTPDVVWWRIPLRLVLNPTEGKTTEILVR